MKTNAVLVAALSAAFLPGAAIADDKVRATLTGYQEVPAVSTVASGTFEAHIHPDGQAFDWELEYSGLQGNVTQAHIHFAQRSVNGSIVVWLCQTATNPGPTGTAMCPQSGRVTGTATAANVTPTGAGAPAQQISAGEIAEVIAAMRSGVAYANVHTSISGGGEIRGQINGSGRGDDAGHSH